MLAETMLDTLHKVPQARVDQLVVSSSSLAPACQEATALHQTQMLGGHMARYPTRLGKLAHRVFPVQQDLDHPNADWVPECAQ
jgi:hypothetical protein